MRTFQVTYLIGRLGGDPELHYTGDGTPVANFRLATDRPVRAGNPPQTDWHTVGVSLDWVG